MAKVYLTILGDYRNYQDVCYRYKNEEIKANCPLKVFVEKENIDKFIIFIPISVLNYKKLKEIYEKNKKNISYLDLEKIVKDSLLNFFKNRTYIEDIENQEKYKIIVIPSSGKFKIEQRGENKKFIFDFKDSFYDILAFMLYTLDKEIPFEENEIFLDITHSVNLFPLYLKQAIESILFTRKYFNNKKQKIKIYCSDAFVFGLQDQVLNINLIYERDIEHKNFEYITSNIKNSFHTPKDINKKDIGNLANKLKIGNIKPQILNLSTQGFFKVLTYAISKNLPLLVTYLISKAAENSFLENLEKHFESIFERYKKNYYLVFNKNEVMKLKENGKEKEILSVEYTIKKEFGFNKNFEPTFISFLLSKAINRTIMENKIIYPTNSKKLELLAKIINYAQEFVLKEISNIYNTLFKNKETKVEKNKFYPLSEIFRKYENSNRENLNSNNKENYYKEVCRHFLAHGGILNNFVEFMVDENNNIFLRYKEDKLLNLLRKNFV